MKGGRVDAHVPKDCGLPLAGISGPSRGEVRVSLRIPEDYPLGQVGEMNVAMNLANGAKLSDTATLVIDERGGTGGSTSETVVPAYKIHQIPVSNCSRLPGNAVHRFLVDADAGSARKSVYELRTGTRSVPFEHIRADVIQSLGGHSWPYGLPHRPES